MRGELESKKSGVNAEGLGTGIVPVGGRRQDGRGGR